MVELDRLAAAIREGDRQAFDQIYAALSPVALRYYARAWSLKPEDGWDCTQDVFLRIWENRRRYNPERPFRPYFNRIMFTVGVNCYRRQRPAIFAAELTVTEKFAGLSVGELRLWLQEAPGYAAVNGSTADESRILRLGDRVTFTVRAEFEGIDPPPVDSTTVSYLEKLRNRSASPEELVILSDCLNRLPTHERLAVYYTHIEGLSQQEAAEVVGVPITTFNNWTARGRKHLKDMLQDKT